LVVCLPPPPGIPQRANQRAMEITQTVSRLAASCRLPEPIDLERNSADAIAPAMTSSALLPHHRAVGTLVQTPRALAGSNYPACRSLPTTGEPTAGPTACRRGHLCRFGFRGRNYLPNAPIGVPGFTTWNRRVLPSSCGCQEGNTTSCILLRYLRTERVTQPCICSDSRPTSSRVQCPFSVQ